MLIWVMSSTHYSIYIITIVSEDLVYIYLIRLTQMWWINDDQCSNLSHIIMMSGGDF